MKKTVRGIGLGLGGLLGLLVLLAIGLPHWVDVDRYRPQLVAAVNERLAGKLELGKLSLSLWGQLKVGIAALELKDAQGGKILSVQDAGLEIPFWGLLTGSPKATLAFHRPEIRLVKQASGQLNVLSLLPQGSNPQPARTPDAPIQASASATPANPGHSSGAPSASPASGNSGTGSVGIPSFLAGARFGLHCKDAHLTYSDQKTATQSEVSKVQILLNDISAVHPSSLEVLAELETQVDRSLNVKGPVRLNAQLVPEGWSSMPPSEPSLGVVAELDLKDLEIRSGGAFHKEARQPLGAHLKLKASASQVQLEEFKVQILSAELSGKGHVRLSESPPRFGLQFQSNAIGFQPWVAVIPALKPFELSGSLQLKGSAQGTSAQPQAELEAQLQQLTFQSPQFKSKTQINAQLKATHNSVELLQVELGAKGVDLKVTAKVASFQAPKGQIQVVSQSLDLDQWLVFPPAPATSTPAGSAPAVTASAGAPSSGTVGGGAPHPSGRSEGDPDALLKPLRDQPWMRAASLSLGLDLKHIKAKGESIHNASCRFEFKDLLAEVKPCGFEVFSGKIQSALQLNFKPFSPTYALDLDMTHLDLTAAAASQVPWAKNTLSGLADFRLKAQGVSFHPDRAQKALRASGSFQVADATFNSIDILKMLKETLNGSIAQVANRVPALKGKTLERMPEIKAQYKQVASDFVIGDQKFSAPHFVAQALPQKGVDLKGTTLIHLKEGTLDTHWEVTDTYNLTHLRDLSVEQAGVSVPHVFAEGDQPIRFTVNVGCQLAAPCYSYKEVPEALAKVALKNLGNALKGKVESEVKQKAVQELKKALPGDLGNKLKGLFH